MFGDGAEAALGDVLEDVSGGVDFLVFAVEGEGEGDAEGVADALGEELFEGEAGFDDAVGREAGFGDAEVEGDVGSFLCELCVDLDDFFPVGVFEGDEVVVELEVVEELAVFEGGGDDGLVVVVGVSLEHSGVDGAAVDADADGEVVLCGGVGDEGDFVGDGFVCFVVVEVSGVVADFVDVRCDEGCEAVVFLEVDGEWCGGLLADLLEGVDVFA